MKPAMERIADALEIIAEKISDITDNKQDQCYDCVYDKLWDNEKEHRYPYTSNRCMRRATDNYCPKYGQINNI